jgi:RNA-directed DNA polymerase
MSSSKNQCIIEMTAEEARTYLLKHESYFRDKLPPYFNFGPLLASIDSFMAGKKLSDFTKREAEKSSKPINIGKLENLNHVILMNKDGRHDWRPFTLIHPVCYVELVQIITESSNWACIQNRFNLFQANSKLVCMSLPVESKSIHEDTGEQILQWWNKIEQKSITLALEYDYMLEADIADCYNSIYTHSVPWALHEKHICKDRIKRGKTHDNSLVGNKIDRCIQDFSNGQTNGIPQGSVLFDFIAEMVLGYIDLLLTQKLEETSIKKGYFILRYRDDYKIFSNDLKMNDQILKSLSEVLKELGLKLNPNKTRQTSDIITDVVKPDKRYWMTQHPDRLSLYNELYTIHQFSRKFPNVKRIGKALGDFRSRFEVGEVAKGKRRIANLKDVFLPPLISILIDIAYHNPVAFPNVAAILSQFFEHLEEDERKNLITKIFKKIEKTSHSSYMEIWLQRAVKDHSDILIYNEPLCKMVDDSAITLWDNEWLQDDNLKSLFSKCPIFDPETFKSLPSVISEEEIEIFHDY